MTFRTTLCAALFLLFPFAALAQFDDPFVLETTLESGADGAPTLSVSFTIPPDHYLYKTSVKVEVPDTHQLTLQNAPKSKKKKDAFLDAEVEVYEEDFRLLYRIQGPAADPLVVSVSYQGCNAVLCFMPQTHTFDLAFPGSSGAATSGALSAKPTPIAPPPPTETPTPSPPPDQPKAQWQALITEFTIADKAEGYLKRAAFIGFLDQAISGKSSDSPSLSERLENAGIFFAIGIILIGGLLLNLTPCVLPMIPINLAIIGSGAQAGSRMRGFGLGGVYGIGIALVYGALGLAVVLTGSKFGAFNASPWFNLAIAAVFVVLGLAMFDLVTIDFTRFRKASPGGASSSGRGSYYTAFFMGCIAALLAGACVAPVLIAVLLISQKLYIAGHFYGLLLPFLLGVGMALPWPFAGAGLSFLPKPGLWMTRVKYAFGILILAFAAYYGYLGYGLFQSRLSTDQQSALMQAQEKSIQEEGWHTSLSAALQQARQEKKPLFIDFWATWCKNCLTMDKTTFKDKAVQENLEAFVKLKYQAENLSAPEHKEVFDYIESQGFKVVGLPLYLVLKPKS